MTERLSFEAAFAALPLVAILRGVQPGEVRAIGDALIEAGFRIIEVPLNSPDPLQSIALLAEAFSGRAVIGAGTVLSTEDVARVEAAGASMVVSPNSNIAVIRASRERGLASLPGFATPSEAFAALDAGATALKLFPAEASSPTILKAMRATFPPETRVLPVGGITPATMQQWTEAGAAGFGLGSAVYKPGYDASEVSRCAEDFVRAYAELR